MSSIYHPFARCREVRPWRNGPQVGATRSVLRSPLPILTRVAFFSLLQEVSYKSQAVGPASGPVLTEGVTFHLPSRWQHFDDISSKREVQASVLDDVTSRRQDVPSGHSHCRFAAAGLSVHRHGFVVTEGSPERQGLEKHLKPRGSVHLVEQLSQTPKGVPVLSSSEMTLPPKVSIQGASPKGRAWWH